MAKRQHTTQPMDDDELHEEALAIALRHWPGVLRDRGIDLQASLDQAWGEARAGIAEFRARLKGEKSSMVGLVAACRLAMEAAHEFLRWLTHDMFSIEKGGGKAARGDLERFVVDHLQGAALWGVTLRSLVHLDAWVIEARRAWQVCEDASQTWELEGLTPEALIRAYKPGGGSPWVAAWEHATRARGGAWFRIKHPDLPAKEGAAWYRRWSDSGLDDWQLSGADSEKHPHIEALLAGAPSLFIRSKDAGQEVVDAHLSDAEFGELRATCIHLEAGLGGHGTGRPPIGCVQRVWTVHVVQEALGARGTKWRALCKAAVIKIGRGRAGSSRRLTSDEVLAIGKAGRDGKFTNGEVYFDRAVRLVKRAQIAS